MAYDLIVKDLQRPFFDVVPRCMYRTKPGGKELFGKVTECSSDQEPFKVEGCYLTCNSTSVGVAQGYEVWLGSMQKRVFGPAFVCPNLAPFCLSLPACWLHPPST